MAQTPDWLIERLAAGDLPESEAAAVRARLEAEPGGLERLAALEASDAAILAAHPPARVAASIRQRADARPFFRRFGPLALVLPAGAAVALALSVGGPLLQQQPPAELHTPVEMVRLKGAEPKLLVHRKRGNTAEQLEPGAPAGARDLLQVSYQAAGEAYGVVLSLDGRGNVMLHLPEVGSSASRLVQGGAIALPQAYELDDAPAFERFFLVTAPSPFSVETVLEAARRLASGTAPARDELPLPPALHQTSFLLKKVP